MSETTLSSGIITFLFTDIQGSTPLWEQDPGGMHISLEQHNRILHEAITTNGGIVVKIVGDEFQAAFVDPAAAVSAALASQRGLAAVTWGSTGPLRVRMGLHMGFVQAEGDDYISTHTLNRVARIMASGHGGQILLSGEVADLVRAGLPQHISLLDLGRHHMKGMEEPEHIYQLVTADLPGDFPPIRSLTRFSSNLPAQPTPFVGRETELLELENFLDQDTSRLLTIVGPGGMGKTRLALAAAEMQLETGWFPDGITFIPLAPLSEIDQIIPTMAQALNLPLESGAENEESSAKQQLLVYLGQKKMLFVLDNFEHLLDGADIVVDISQSAPDVQILVTSRERLQLRNEQVYPIEGLEFPDWETPQDAERYTAVQLFLQSARRSQPDFALSDDDDLTTLARICRLVAGMPLALELAASWVDMLPLAKIAAELRQGLDLLKTDVRDMPERQRSVRATIDYSWQKLGEKERGIFANLSIFRGGFTREAARTVTGVNLRQLARLVNKSFLQYNQADDRYQVHELMRQYGAEKLTEGGRETAVRDQHSSFYCRALQQWEAKLNSSQQQTAVAKIEADYRNILVVWEYALDRGHLDQLLIAVNGLGEYFDAKGRWNEGINLFQESIQRLRPNKDVFPVSPEEAQLLIWCSVWALNLDINSRGNNVDPDDAYRRLLRPSLGLLELDVLFDRDTRAEEAFLRLQLGRMLKRTDDYWEEGNAHLTTCLHLYRELGDLLGEADALYESHFYNSDRELYEQAQDQLQESLKILQQLGEPRRLTRVLLGLGVVTSDLHDFDMAIELYERAYATAKAAGYLIGMVDARHIAIQEAWYLGQFDLALGHSKELFDLARQANSPSKRIARLNARRINTSVSRAVLGGFGTVSRNDCLSRQ